MLIKEFDLMISHNQIRLENTPYREDYCDWGKVNIELGALIFESFVSFDPLPDDAFGAKVSIYLEDGHNLNSDIQRSIKVPFKYSSKEKLYIASAFEKYEVNINIDSGMYELYFDILELEEICYNFTLIKVNDEEIVTAEYIMSDDFGGVKGKTIPIGKL